MAAMELIRSQLFEKYKQQGLSDEEALLRADKEAQVQTQQAEDVVRKKLEKKPSTLELLRYGKDWNKEKGKNYNRGRAYKE